MEVLLKKTKITNNIFKQTLVASVGYYYKRQGFDILGWCVVVESKKARRWVLIFNEKTQELLKIPYINKNSPRIESKSVQEDAVKGGYTFFTYHHVHSLAVDFNKLMYINRFLDISDAENTVNLLLDFAKESDLKGQIYL